jgi:hypothetical protein
MTMQVRMTAEVIKSNVATVVCMFAFSSFQCPEPAIIGCFGVRNVSGSELSTGFIALCLFLAYFLL